jgi:toluene monooxygenase system protein E
LDPVEHRATWERQPFFQPLRRLIEQALVQFDWGEAFVVLNVVIKPRLDRWINREFAGNLGELNGDPILRSIHFSFDQDSQWHRDWTRALLHLAIADDPDNGDLVRRWVAKWQPLADEAVEALVGEALRAPQPLEATAVGARIRAEVEADVETFLGTDHPRS